MNKCLPLRFLWLLFFWLVWGESSYSNSSLREAQVWKGELFSKKQGALLFSLDYGDDIADILASRINFRIVNLITKKNFQISVEGFSAFAAHTEMLHKLPSGKYVLKSIQFSSTSGKRFRWKVNPKKPVTFYIIRQVISNAGVWKLKLSSSGRLRFLIKKFNVKKEKNWLQGFRETAAAVVDAKSKIVQLTLGGKKIQRQAATLVTDDTDAFSVISHKRTISFYYSVDLLRNNRFAQRFANTLSAHDATLRNCYTESLESSSTGSGKLTFSILYSGSKKRIVKLQKSSGSNRLESAAQCIYEKLQDIPFTISKTMAGRITFTMSIK